MCHVLIIEDEPLVAMDLQDMLGRIGATSFAFAETEDEAIFAARERLPDVITSDVILREGTGPHAVRCIQNEFGPLPVIFITATPGSCAPCPPPACILCKPIVTTTLTHAFLAIAPR